MEDNIGWHRELGPYMQTNRGVAFDVRRYSLPSQKRPMAGWRLVSIARPMRGHDAYLGLPPDEERSRDASFLGLRFWRENIKPLSRLFDPRYFRGPRALRHSPAVERSATNFSVAGLSENGAYRMQLLSLLISQ